MFSNYLTPFKHLPVFSKHLEAVLNQLPTEVQEDFLNDPNFRIALDNCEPGKGRTVLMPDLGPQGTSRCVVFKPRLEQCSDAFALYIIAHEFAHAFLHNGSWGDIADPEEAADALAYQWGYAKQPFEWVVGQS